ncbi:MAG: PEP-CTERM sorting domain-containing protein [Planctomycetota bacterium]|nr:PEP-CTERM sorting domain-containing protein [Planctomycetota bacterium]
MRQSFCFGAIVAALATFCLLNSAQATTVTFGSGSDTFNIEFMPIGNPGNTADTSGNPNPAGQVNYLYEMGKLEISRQQVNRVNNLSGLGITMGDLATPVNYGGNGNQKPATSISWREAARFVNFLNTDQGFSPAYKFALQPGDVGYTIAANNELWAPSDPGYNASNQFRNSNALFFLPSLDEWYKAAYFNPNTLAWRNYATGDGVPSIVTSGVAGGAVYNQLGGNGLGPAIVSESASLSLHGTLGQTGNVWEILETASDLTNNDPAEQRIRRGGGWNVTDATTMSVSFFNSSNPQQEQEFTGFRVAMVPEPSSIALLGLGAISLTVLARRRMTAR